MSGPYRFVLQILRRVGQHDVLGRGAQVAFFFLIAVFPTILAVVGILSFFNLDAHIITFQSLVREGAPTGVADLILGELANLQPWHGWPMLFGLVLTAYYASFTVGTLMRGVTAAWSVQTSELRVRLVGFGLAGFIVAALPLLLGLLTVATWVVLWSHGAGLIPDAVAYAVTFLRWPILFVFFQQIANLIYRTAARKALRWGWISWGSVLASLSWVVITEVFERYVDLVANLGTMYGSLGTAVGLLFYAHLVGTAVLLGAEIDAQIAADRSTARN